MWVLLWQKKMNHIYSKSMTETFDTSKAFEEEFFLTEKLLDKVRNLPKKWGVHLRFVDYDGTILDDQKRFLIDPRLALKENRWDGALSYIRKNYPTPEDPSWIKNFVAKLEPRNSLYTNYQEYFDPNKETDYILTAGNIDLQLEKIVQSWLKHAQKRIVAKAAEKPLTILLTILKLGYRPEKVSFYDDRIDNFQWIDSFLSRKLGINFEFFRVQANPDRFTTRVQLLTSRSVEDILSWDNLTK